MFVVSSLLLSIRDLHTSLPKPENSSMTYVCEAHQSSGIRGFTSHRFSAERFPNFAVKSATASTQFHLSLPLNLRQRRRIYYAGTCAPEREDIPVISG